MKDGIYKGKSRFGRWTLINRLKGNRFLARCDCGSERMVYASNLIRGASASCGCLNAEMASRRSRRHGETGSPTHRTWSAMLSRCTNQKNPAWNDYGGRGIRVCERWTIYELFRDDMGPRPPGTSLDRINNDGNYEPGNCRWATKQQQARNTRWNHMVSAFGRRMPIVTWAAEIGVQPHVIGMRLRRLHWSAERALATPIRKRIHESASSCTRGHPLTPENTRLKKSRGYTVRTCRICQREDQRAQRAAR